MTRTPEDEAREQIDGMLDAAGWNVCGRNLIMSDLFEENG